MKIVTVALLLSLSIGVFASDTSTFTMSSPTNNSCLIVRSGVSHRARNAILLGVPTLGLASAPAALLSGTRYERVDGFGPLPFKQKYSGKSLRKLDAAGTHIVVVAREADISNPRGLCGFTEPTQPMMSPQAQGWIQMPMQNVQPMPPMAQPVATVERRSCIATRIERDGTETCTAWSPR